MEGNVHDAKMAPLLNATVKLTGSDRVFEVTKKTAHFKLLLLPGKYNLEIACHGYETTSKQFVIIDGNMTSLRVILYETKSTPSAPEIYQGTIVESNSDKEVITDSSMHEPFNGIISTGIRGDLMVLSNPVFNTEDIFRLRQRLFRSSRSECSHKGRGKKFHRLCQ